MSNKLLRWWWWWGKSKRKERVAPLVLHWSLVESNCPPFSSPQNHHRLNSAVAVRLSQFAARRSPFAESDSQSHPSASSRSAHRWSHSQSQSQSESHSHPPKSALQIEIVEPTMDISAYQHMNIRMSTRGKRPLRNLTPNDKVRAIQRKSPYPAERSEFRERAGASGT